MIAFASSTIHLGDLVLAACVLCLVVGFPLYVLGNTRFGRAKALLCYSFFCVGIPSLFITLFCFAYVFRPGEPGFEMEYSRRPDLTFPLIAGATIGLFIVLVVVVAIRRARIAWREPLFCIKTQPSLPSGRGVSIAQQDLVLAAALRKLAGENQPPLTAEELGAARLALKSASERSESNSAGAVPASAGTETGANVKGIESAEGRRPPGPYVKWQLEGGVLALTLYLATCLNWIAWWYLTGYTQMDIFGLRPDSLANWSVTVGATATTWCILSLLYVRRIDMKWTLAFGFSVVSWWGPIIFMAAGHHIRK